MPHGGLCPWPTFHAWVTMARKKLLSIYYNTYECYSHQTCTNCSSWHDQLMSCGGLCPWPTFHASVTKTQNGNSGAPVIVMVPKILCTFICYFCTEIKKRMIRHYEIFALYVFCCRTSVTVFHRHMLFHKV